MLTGRYEVSLVVVSILVAVFASYTALSLAGRVAKVQGPAVRWWIAGGAFAMGVGIWAMHFIGMLAFRLPILLGYDLGITLLSLVLPIMVSGLALWQVSKPELPFKRLVSGALLMGLGINSMHYTGMAAMRMQPGILYDPLLFAASVLIAVGASGAALWIAFRLRRDLPHVWIYRLGAAVVMGMAIVGMHYTGMAAAHFPEGSICMAATGGFSQDALALAVTIATLGILTIAMLASVFDARLESRTEILAMSQATSAERQVLLTRERAARDEAERMSALKDEFLATLSHELRTPLNSVLGWAQILRTGFRDEATLQKGLDTIERNARAQAQLIDDLLDMSRIISGKIRIEMRQIAPSAFIDAALETVSPAAIAKNIHIEKSIDPGIGLISGDPNRLQQVLWNLLSNAVKFTPENGKIHVGAKKAGKHVEISVADSGAGISADFLPYVFERFRQEDASTTRRYGGLGLGLSIVKHLVELHGGSIHASSHGEGKGAIFSLSLPIFAANAQKDHDVPASTPAGVMAQTEQAKRVHDLSGINVLVIDDETDALHLVKEILARCGATVCAIDNPHQALKRFELEMPDIIVSDIGMPGMDGYELIRHIRALDAANGGLVPAIALTAFARADDRKRAIEAGFTKYMSKPVEPEELIANIAALSLSSLGQKK
jgi:signal transduction histidine kinase/CheY-like chemotaxis protein